MTSKIYGPQRTKKKCIKKLAWNYKERDNLGGNNIKSPQERKGVTEQVSTN